MALTLMQNLPKKDENKEGWSMRKVFSVESVVSALKGIYVNIEEILCTYLVLVIGTAELFGRTASWRIYALVVLLIAIITVDRYFPNSPEKPCPPTKNTPPESSASSTTE